MTLRNYQPSDCRETARLFYETVHTINARDYTQEQLDAWAPESRDLEEWNRNNPSMKMTAKEFLSM